MRKNWTYISPSLIFTAISLTLLPDKTSPSDLPVETADYFLGINSKTALAMGLEIPDNVLEQADFIIRE